MERADAVNDQTRPRAFSSHPEMNVGHFLLHTLLTELKVKDTIDILSDQMRFQFSV